MDETTLAQILARLAIIEQRLGIVQGTAHPFVFDDVRRVVACPNGKPARLNPLEYILLRRLLDDPHQVVSYADLKRALWNTVWIDTSNLTVLVHGLRRKIETDPQHPRYIVNKKGVGYAITWDEDDST